MYTPVSFHQENAKHEACIDVLVRYYKDTAKIHRLEGKNENGFDLMLTFNNNPDTIYNVEIKTVAGETKGIVYNTFSLETYTDHEQTKLTEWRSAKGLDYLIVFNRYARKAYVYDVSILRDYVWKNEHKARASGVGTGQWNTTEKKCSWVLLIKWQCPEAGFIRELDLAGHW